VQSNLNILRERGAIVLAPGSGRLAAKGEHGVGRLPEPAELLAACERVLTSRSHGDGAIPAASTNGWAGVRVLVTAGGTREPIDSVRFLGNSSSGRMGFALASAARARGARVTLVAANTALPAPEGVELCAVRTAQELKDACEQAFASCDVLLMAAAVADFRPAERTAGKISKSGRKRLQLDLEPTADVLATLAARRHDGQVLVGFAADHGEHALHRAREKLQAKALDAIVVNDISRADIGFDSEHNEVTMLTAERSQRAASARGSAHATASHEPKAQHLARATKSAIAEQILDAVERLRAHA
jgi:phosphopantothenoylcysteine decarboxylase/phosphopantothenate--cysteine ligase